MEFRAETITLSFMWFTVAQSVVDKAIEVYKCTPEQAVALRKAFLRPNDYVVRPLAEE